MDERKKGQIALEYIILTAFILVAVTIIFAISFMTYTQYTHVAKARDTMAKMASAVDNIYARGIGNRLFTDLSIPDALKEITIVHKCVEGRLANQGSLQDCSSPDADSYNFVQFSAISMTLQTVGGPVNILQETKAKVVLDSEISAMNAEGTFNKYSGSYYFIKVYWNNDSKTIKIDKV